MEDVLNLDGAVFSKIVSIATLTNHLPFLSSLKGYDEVLCKYNIANIYKMMEINVGYF